MKVSISSSVRYLPASLVLATAGSAFFALSALATTANITTTTTDDRDATAGNCFGPSASSVMQKANAGMTISAHEQAIASQCQEQWQKQHQSIGDTTATGGKSSIYNADGSFSPTAKSKAESFAKSNSNSSVGDLAQNLGVDLKTAQKLNNTLNLGLSQANSQATTLGNVGSGNVGDTVIYEASKPTIIPATIAPHNPLQGQSGQRFAGSVYCPTGAITSFDHQTFVSNESSEWGGGIALSILSLQARGGKSTNGVLKAPAVAPTTVASVIDGFTSGKTIANNCPTTPPAPPTTFVPPAPPTVIIEKQ